MKPDVEGPYVSVHFKDGGAPDHRIINKTIFISLVLADDAAYFSGHRTSPKRTDGPVPVSVKTPKQYTARGTTSGNRAINIEPYKNTVMLGTITGDTVGSIYEFNNTKDYNFTLFNSERPTLTTPSCRWPSPAGSSGTPGTAEEAMVEFGEEFPCPTTPLLAATPTAAGATAAR